MKNYVKDFIFVAIIILFGIFAIRGCNKIVCVTEVVRDTVTIVRVDTVHHTNVIYKDRWHVRTDTIVHVEKGDTVYVPVPIDKHVFTDDSTYHAEVSGFKVTMDKMDVYNRYTERVVTITPKPKRWGLGIQAGYGFGKNGMQPYVGVGVSYNVFNF